MTDLPISNRYKLYKEGTKSLVRWVNRKASSYSNAADYLRTLARPDCAATTLTTRDLVWLTKLIVANDAVEIPEDILNITQDIVAERQVCANWYKDQNMNGELTASDKTHAYFIGTLNEIYDILHSARASQKHDYPRPPQQTSSESIPGEFNNSFQHLKVEEPVENPLGTTTGTVEGFTVADKLTFRLEKQKSDKAFAIWCLLEDFRNVREYIAGLSRDYKAGRKSLLATGAITDAAFGLMRHANDDFANDNGDVANYQAMVAFLEKEMLVAVDGETMQDESTNSGSMNGEPNENTRKTSGHRRCFTGPDLDSILCREAGQLFELLSDVFQTNGEAASLLSSCNLEFELPLGAFGDTLLKLAWTIKQLAIDYAAISPTEGKHYRLSRDEFLSALINYALKSEYSQAPMWLVAAGQCYKDIYDILSGERSCGAEAFCSYLHRVRPRAKRAKMVQSLRPNPGSKKAKAMEHVTRQKVFNLLAGESLSIAFDASRHLAQIAEYEDWNFNYLASSAALAQFLPVYPCVFNFRIHYEMSFYSLQFLGVFIVLSMAHLSKAGQEYGLIKSDWKDMDFILANHVSFNTKLKGSKPIVQKLSRRSDPFEMVALFRAGIGVPTVDLDKPVRPRLPELPMASTRGVTYQSDLMKAMRDTEGEVVHLGVSDREHVNLVLRKLSDLENKGKNKGRTTTKYTLVELLETYEKHFAAAEPLLTFDYIGFIDLCSEQSHDLCAHHPIGRTNAPMPPIPDFVDCLLWTAADVVRKSKHRSPDELHKILSKTKFGRVVTDLEVVIKDMGGDCHKGLF
jgi:hypothetical protein